MNKFTLLILSSLFATGSYAASHMGEAQAPGSPKAQAAAEAKHNEKSHGTDKSAKQPEAQAPGSPKAQAAAEAKHNVKPHGVDAVRSIPLADGSTVYVFKDGKMGMEDKMGRAVRMKPGHVMKAKDGTSLMMVGDEVMRMESIQTGKKGGPN